MPQVGECVSFSKQSRNLTWEHCLASKQGKSTSGRNASAGKAVGKDKAICFSRCRKLTNTFEGISVDPRLVPGPNQLFGNLCSTCCDQLPKVLSCLPLCNPARRKITSSTILETSIFVCNCSQVVASRGRSRNECTVGAFINASY